MKKKKFFHSVQRKILIGYSIVGLFAAAFMIIAVTCNQYVSTRYEAAISDVVSLNELENLTDQLNSAVNMAYNFLETSAPAEYAAVRENLEESLSAAEEAQTKRFVREVTDAVKTVESYMQQSDSLMDRIAIFFAGNNRSGIDEMQVQYNELQEIYSYTRLRFQNAYSVELATLNEMAQQLSALQHTLTLVQVGILLVALSFGLFYLSHVIRGISRSINTLRTGVQSMQENVLETKPIEIHSGDEFEEFAEGFNEMTAIIQQQMIELEETAKIKEQLAEMEIKNLRMFGELQKNHLDFLQSRVNPHFLFNTLNMISSLARIEGADQCAELMETTAAFLRYNLDNISKTVTLQKEVKNLQDYVAIQECRYGDRFQYTFDIDEETLKYPMPCMVLQPLVENSIQHGMPMMLSGGEVNIRTYRKQERVLIEVSDNGIGMSEEQIREVYHDLSEHQYSGTHIGIRNIYQRLRIYYNDDVQMTFVNLDPGLRITISLPGKEIEHESDDRDRG